MKVNLPKFLRRINFRFVIKRQNIINPSVILSIMNSHNITDVELSDSQSAGIITCIILFLFALNKHSKVIFSYEIAPMCL